MELAILKEIVYKINIATPIALVLIIALDMRRMEGQEMVLVKHKAIVI